MVFKTRITTVLFAAILLSLASIVFAAKANAQEFLTEDVLLGKKVQACPMAQFIVVANLDCKKPSTLTSGFKPATVILPSTSPTLAPKPQESSPGAAFAPVSNPITTTQTATLSAELLFNLVNEHRTKLNLPAFEHDGGVCAVAEARKNEIVNEIFVTHALHSGFYAKNLPYWATENLIWQHSEAEALNWWLHSPVHRAAVEGNYKYACGVCNGEVCNMVFTNYEQKTLTVAPIATTPAGSNSTPLAQPATFKEKLTSAGINP